jgi:chromosome condensin MukBEF complex kleisin-like MukF subunit
MTSYTPESRFSRTFIWYQIHCYTSWSMSCTPYQNIISNLVKTRLCNIQNHELQITNTIYQYQQLKLILQQYFIKQKFISHLLTDRPRKE